MSEVQFQQIPSRADAIVRRVISTPVRSATDTWTAISALLAPDPTSLARRELNRMSGLACVAISSEAMRHDPLELQSRGLTVRIYCLHGEDAIMTPGYDLHEFAWCPTEEEWAMSIPCEASDLRWLNRELASMSANAIFRSVGEAPRFGAPHEFETQEPKPRLRLANVLKMGAFFRP
ncbi:MAG: hypothetical protein KJZ70_11600 [Bryobacterales bacterium]|nr:hypothetical protein [Bryobacterales bacterium]